VGKDKAARAPTVRPAAAAVKTQAPQAKPAPPPDADGHPIGGDDEETY